MAFAFTQRSHVGAQIRAIAASQVEKSLVACRDTTDFDGTVHMLRRRSKRLRGLLRLVRPVFKDYARENTAIRDAASGLSGVRDAAVMASTFDSLCIAYPRSVPLDLETLLRQRLAAQIAALGEANDPSKALDAFATAMGAVADRIETWHLPSGGFSVIAPGLTQGHKRLVSALRKAEDDPNGEMLHEWRKAVKYHWHHANLLRKTAPDLIGATIATLDAAGEYLGDHHNLTVLDAWVRDENADLDTDALRPLKTIIHAEQERLAGKAFAIGRQLAAEPGSLVLSRFKAFWKLLPKDA